MTSPAQRPDSTSDVHAPAPTAPHLSVVDGDQDADFSVRVPYHGVSVIGINPGGFDDLSATAQGLIQDADLIIGSSRQLELIPSHIDAERRSWPSPLVPAINEMLKNWRHQNIVVLGSGDPMFHGIGTTLAREFGADNFRVYPAPSSAALACAELKWPVHNTPVVSLVTNPIESLRTLIDAGQPFLVLGRDRFTPQAVATYLHDHGQAQANLHVLSDLSGPAASRWSGKPAQFERAESSLNVIAVEPVPVGESLLPGLSDTSYDHDGQITKTHVRALSVAALRPRPGMLLWDIGGGSGSISIEFLRSTPGTNAVAFERSELRQARIRHNADALGVPHLEVAGAFPLERSDRPDAVFIGGGLTVPGVFEQAWEALKPGGRLVANAVTIESQSLLSDLRHRYGGELTRVEISHEHAIGSFISLQPALPVWQWVVRKPSTES